MKKYEVEWSKTYYATGTVEIDADSEEQAYEIAEANSGDYQGTIKDYRLAIHRINDTYY